MGEKHSIPTYRTPIYRLTIDERFDYLLNFSPLLDQGREERAIGFMQKKFTDLPEYSFKMLSPSEQKREKKQGRIVLVLSQSDAEEQPIWTRLNRGQ